MSERDQRRRAGRVDRDAGAAQIKKIGSTRSQNRHRAAREAVNAQLMLPRQLMVVPVGTTNEDTAVAAGQSPCIVCGVFNAVPARLQKEALLRVHALGFDGRDVEEQRVETVV